MITLDTTVQTPVEKPHLLVFDDSADNRLLVRYFVSSLDVQIHEFPNGEITPERLVELKPIGILLDWIMPQVGGEDLLKTIEAHQPDLLKRCVILTGMPDEDEVTKWKHKGCQILGKPFSKQQILDSIQSFA